MAITVGIHEGQAHLARLVAIIEQTREHVVVTRRGRPVARIVPLDDRPADKAAADLGVVTLP